MQRCAPVVLVAALCALATTGAQAGGPLVVCNGGPVKYPRPADLYVNYDLGGLGTRTKSQADALVASAASVWTDLTTSSISIGRGADLSEDVTAANYSTYIGNYTDGLNPVIYDTDGSIVDAYLGAGSKNSVPGFAASLYYGTPTCQYVEGHVVINGFLAAGASDDELKVTIAHELGHLIGLDHAQLDSSQGLAPADYPLMYPIASRSTATLHEDDAAAVSALYPGGSVTLTYGQLTGAFVLADGASPVLGANLWAEETTTHAVYSIVSDYLAQGTGSFKLLLPDGVYNLHAQAVRSGFTGDRSVGPYAETSGDASFLPPNYVGGVPMATVTLGNGTPTSFQMNHGCAATVTFRIDGTGTVGGNCAGTGPPDAPIIGTAAGGPGQVTVTFTPGDLHGATLIYHRAQCVPGSGNSSSADGTGSPIAVPGLTSGLAYQCRVMTRTTRGDSAWSAVSNWATPTDGPPATPAIGLAVAGSGQMTVHFTPGSLNGGTLTTYQASCAPVSGTPTYQASGTSSPIVVTGLIGAITYQCQARTVTNLGTSPWSAFSNRDTVASTTGPPGAPAMGSAVAGPARITVSFTPGSLNGGTLVHYAVSCVPSVFSSTVTTVFGYGTSSPVVVEGLTSGVAYQCWVRTLTSLGYGPESGGSSSATPTDGPPAMPIMGGAMAGLGNITVNFTPGSMNGAWHLVQHHATCAAPGATRAYDGYGGASPIVVTGLPAGVAYRCWVRTVTNQGTGAWSVASNWATPTDTLPVAPAMGPVTPGPAQLSVAFTPRGLNGGVLVHHQVTCTHAGGFPEAFDGYGASSPVIVAGLASGTPYHCWARTITDQGKSAWSGVSEWATPNDGPPQAPFIGAPTPGSHELSVPFTLRSLNGGVLVSNHVTCTAASGPAYDGDGATSPIVVSGLTPATAYRCWARTITNLGTSAWSGASTWVAPNDTVPSAPFINMATAGGGQLTVEFAAGDLWGGTLAYHQVVCVDAPGVAYYGYGNASPIVVAGLTSGTPYHCWVRTVTDLGPSAWSNVSKWVTPFDGPPAMPIMGTVWVGSQQVIVTFTPGSLNGGTLINHQVTCTGTSTPAYDGYGIASPIAVTGLTGGTAYRCWARTITNRGPGGWSNASDWATPTP